jgi:hypothetical protein
VLPGPSSSGERLNFKNNNGWPRLDAGLTGLLLLL